LILENIDKMDIGAVSMLNNFWQDLKKGSLFVNGNEYRMPEKGMILLVAREEVNWSAAESSRPFYLRVKDDRSFAARVVDLIQEFVCKEDFKRIDERFKPFKLDIGTLISSFFLQAIKDQSNLQTLLQKSYLTHILQNFVLKLSPHIEELEKNEKDKKLNEEQKKKKERDAEKLKLQLETNEGEGSIEQLE
jgi:hypothetical protein